MEEALTWFRARFGGGGRLERKGMVKDKVGMLGTVEYAFVDSFIH